MGYRAERTWKLKQEKSKLGQRAPRAAMERRPGQGGHIIYGFARGDIYG